MSKQLTKKEAQQKTDELINKRNRNKEKIFKKDPELFYKYCEVVNNSIMNLAKILNPEKYGDRN